MSLAKSLWTLAEVEEVFRLFTRVKVAMAHCKNTPLQVLHQKQDLNKSRNMNKSKKPVSVLF